MQVLRISSHRRKALRPNLKRSRRAHRPREKEATPAHSLPKYPSPSSPPPTLTENPPSTDRRWDTDFLTLLALLKDNALGRITEFETHFDRHRPTLPSGGSWKTKTVSGGGAIYDLGTHLIDQVVVAFGLPRRVTGFVGSQREDNPAGYEDSCTVLLHYDQMIATVKTAVVSLEESQLRFWVRGVEGTYKKVRPVSKHTFIGPC